MLSLLPQFKGYSERQRARACQSPQVRWVCLCLSVSKSGTTERRGERERERGSARLQYFTPPTDPPHLGGLAWLGLAGLDLSSPLLPCPPAGESNLVVITWVIQAASPSPLQPRREQLTSTSSPLHSKYKVPPGRKH
jgi:hypothetical protein